MIFTKNKEGVRAIWAIKYKNYVVGKYTRARAPLARKYTNRIFESKDGTTTMKIVNYVARHNFCWNDLLTKSNRSEIQTYKVEERTFGTPVYAPVTEPDVVRTCYLKKVISKVIKTNSKWRHTYRNCSWQMYNYEINHIWELLKWNQVKKDPRSFERDLSTCVR